MSVRTLIAKDMLAAIAVSPGYVAEINKICAADGDKMYALSARVAVMYADALIRELSKE